MEHMDLLGSLVIRPRKYHTMYLKWSNKTIGIVAKDGSVAFSQPSLNKTVAMITGGRKSWTSQEFREFLVERLPSSSRRDIEKILRRCKLSEYDEIAMAYETRALNARDLLWLARDEEEKFEGIVDKVFTDIFVKRLDLQGDSLFSPEGVNVKRYGVSYGNYGLYKKRLHPFSSDVEAEVAVYEIGRLLGVDCCPAWLVETDNDVECFSKFQYNFASEYIVHIRRLLDPERSENEYDNLVDRLPYFKEEIQKMILLDFVTRQTDRHASNMALKVKGDKAEFYNLYDNGRSLFYEDKEDFIKKALKDIPLYSTEFGQVGTYYDHVLDICKETDVAKLINLDVSENEIAKAVQKSGIKEARSEGAITWVYECLQLIKKM
jgi:hypothetical protein